MSKEYLFRVTHIKNKEDKKNIQSFKNQSIYSSKYNKILYV